VYHTQIYSNVFHTVCCIQPIRHPDMRVKHGSIWTFTSIAVTLYADVCIYKTERRGKILFRKKVL